MALSKRKMFFCGIILTTCTIGCGKTDDLPPQTELPRQELPANGELIVGGGNYVLSLIVNAYDEWTVEMEECSWCKVSPTSGDRYNTIFKIFIDRNNTSDERTVKFTVDNGWFGRATYMLVQGNAG